MTGSQGLAKVFYTHWTPPVGSERLTPLFEVVHHPSPGPPTVEEIVSGARDAFALCVSVRDMISAAVLAQCPRLRIVSSFGRGHDNIDVEAATRLGVWVTNVPDVLAEPTAEMAWALLLSLSRKTVAGDALVRRGRFLGWEPQPPVMGAGLFGRTLGILGMGQVGRAVARRAAGFSVRVLYWDPRRLSAAEEAALNLQWAPRETLLTQSDFVCVCSPLTEETYHLIGARELSLMKPTALLINPARGSLVDETLVGEALATGRLGGYAADAFEMEDRLHPGPARIPDSLLHNHDRTVLTPHAATAIAETREQIALAQAQAVLDVYHGRVPPGAVNRPALPAHA